MSKPNLKEPGKQAAPAKAKPQQESPSAPKLRVGDVVYWYFAGDPRNGGLAAIVTMVHGQGNLCLTVFTSNGMEVFDGVKHKDDPTLNENSKTRSGCWGHRE